MLTKNCRCCGEAFDFEPRVHGSNRKYCEEHMGSDRGPQVCKIPGCGVRFTGTNNRQNCDDHRGYRNGVPLKTHADYWVHAATKKAQAVKPKPTGRCLTCDKEAPKGQKYCKWTHDPQYLDPKEIAALRRQYAERMTG